MMRAVFPRSASAAAAILAMLAGCGHDVEPAGIYRDPGAIPNARNFQVLQAQSGVNLVWESDPEMFAIIDGFYLFRALVEPGMEPEFLRLNDAPFLESTFADANIENDRTYGYQIASVTPAGVLSEPSIPQFITIDFIPPRPPETIEAVAFLDTVVIGGEPRIFDKVRVAWSPSPDEDVATYRLFRLPPFPNLGPIELPLLEFEDSLVEPAFTYRYYVTAVDDNGNEGVESGVAAVTIPFNP